jgi:putative ABC transport system ATP-binding protein
MPGTRIDLTDVVKVYRTGDGVEFRALDQITVTIPAGDTVAVVGASGSGKSTLLHLVAAMDVPDRGAITVDGVDLTRMRDRDRAAYRRRIGVVFQRFHLLPALSALDNVCAPLLPYRTNFDVRARARDLLDQVGLTDRAHNLASRLSGGEQQRVAIARALVNNPGLVIADEPSGNLDSTTGTQIMDLILDLATTHGHTLIVATHDHDIAGRCNRRIRLHDGTITHDTTTTTTPATTDRT